MVVLPNTRISLMGCAVILVVCIAAGVASGSQLEWTQWLQQREEAVLSCHAVYTIRVSPTSPSSEERLKKAYAAIGIPERWDSECYSSEAARQMSMTMESYRSGQLERSNVLSQADSGTGPSGVAIIQATAFDGNVVRSLSYREPRPSGSIRTMQQANWTNTNWHYPFNLLFEYQKTPYSEIIAASPDFEEREISVGGEQCREIGFSHPNIQGMRFVLVFDARGDLIERREYLHQNIAGREYDVLKERHVLSAYEDTELGGGSAMRFPRKAEIHMYSFLMDAAGEPIETGCETIDMARIEFNIDVPGDVFQLKFPADAVVRDGLTGMGQISVSGTPDSLLAEELASVAQQALDEPNVSRPARGVPGSGVAVSDEGRRQSRLGGRPVRYVVTACALLVMGAMLVSLYRRRRRSSE